MTETEFQSYKEEAIRKDMCSIENRIRHVFHQGVECGVKMEREKQKMGHWIYRSDFPFRWECDKCGGFFKTDFNFCPNCGAKMESEG